MADGWRMADGFGVSPRTLGKWSNLTHIFQVGWNHLKILVVRSDTGFEKSSDNFLLDVWNLAEKIKTGINHQKVKLASWIYETSRRVIRNSPNWTDQRLLKVYGRFESLKKPEFALKWSLGGGFKYFLFSPRTLGKWSNLTSIFFRMGPFNHQSDHISQQKEARSLHMKVRQTLGGGQGGILDSQIPEKISRI